MMQHSKKNIEACVTQTALIHNVTTDEVYDIVRERSRYINDNPSEIQVGDVGTYTRGGQYGRQYWDGFTVTKIVTVGKKIEVEFDKPILVGDEKALSKPVPGSDYLVIWYTPEEYKYRTLEYRRPGKWMFKGVPAKKLFGSISMGEKRTEIEQGYF
jgi:hypothetical protein